MTRIGSLLASLGFDSLGSLFSLLPGCGFRPRDDELIGFLMHKMHGNESEVELIPVIDICEHEPREIPTLPEFSLINPKDPEWYFFSPIVHKYRDSKRVNRLTKAGYWKPTGQDRDIKDDGEDIIGRKKTLVFYEGRVPHGTKTCWVYHEYQLASPLSDKNPYVLCRLMKKVEKSTAEINNSNSERGELSDSISYALNNDGEPSSNRSPDFGYPQTECSFSEVNDIPQEDSPICQQLADDDYIALMKNFTFPNESNTTPMLSETHDLGEFIPNFPNQSPAYHYYDEPISPYNHSLMQQYFEEAPLSSYGENQIAFTQPNSYSSIGGYDYSSF